MCLLALRDFGGAARRTGHEFYPSRLRSGPWPNELPVKPDLNHWIRTEAGGNPASARLTKPVAWAAPKGHTTEVGQLDRSAPRARAE